MKKFASKEDIPIGFTGSCKTLDDKVVHWMKYGLYHREKGPAIILPDWRREWWHSGKRHRLDGPAVEWTDGMCQWWVDDRMIAREEQFNVHPKVLAYKLETILNSMI